MGNHGMDGFRRKHKRRLMGSDHLGQAQPFMSFGHIILANTGEGYCSLQMSVLLLCIYVTISCF